MIGKALCVTGTIVLASCVPLQTAQEPPRDAWPVVSAPIAKPEPVVEEPPEVDVLLSEFERFRRLSAADLTREQEAARQAFTQTRRDAARVQFAMTLSVPGSPTADESRALELLEPLVKNPGAPLHGVAFVLATHIVEQRRLLAQLQTAQQSNQGLQQNVQALQQNVQGLQQKLDALRTLERSLSERGETPSRKR